MIFYVTGSEASPVVSKVLERAALAGVDEVQAALRHIDGRRGRG